MNFVDAFGNKTQGFPKINLDLVATLKAVQGADGKWTSYKCYDSQGECVGQIDGHLVEETAFAIIPDSTGTLLVAPMIEADGSTALLRYPVLAWKVDSRGYSAEPVICEGLPSHWVLQLPSGSFVAPEDCYFDTEEQVIEHFKEECAPRPKAASL